MFNTIYSDLESYFRKNEKTYTPMSKPEEGFTFNDKHGTRHEYLESDHGGHTEYGGPTSCYYNEFGDS